MLKVSFKEGAKKVQTFNEKATIVTLVGHMQMPNTLWSVFPNMTANWMWNHPGVDASWGTCTKENEVIRLEVSGKSVCAEEDTWNPIIGERIAEARAKLKIYKFMYNLCRKLLWDYFDIGYGNAEIELARENHNEPPKDCIWTTLKKYKKLYSTEYSHLNKLLKEA
jgi:hypothetical protein